jgi:DNA polymerase/3'-5' exonuclease PolX
VNPDVAEIFEKVAGPLEIEDESRFKIKAYRDAARLWTDTRARP